MLYAGFACNAPRGIRLFLRKKPVRSSEAPPEPLSLPLRSHPALVQVKRKAIHKGWLSFLARPAGFDFACGRSPFAALRLHWSLIHYRSVLIPLWCKKKESHPQGMTFLFGAPRGIRTHDLLIRRQRGGLQKPTRNRHFLRFMINLTTILTTKPDFLEHFGTQFLAVV